MRRTAFTLLELMIVVGIILFLAGMTLPRFSSYFDRARQAEVALHLTSLHAAEQMHYALHGTFTDKLSGHTSLNWHPTGNNSSNGLHYSYGFFMPHAQKNVHYVVGADFYRIPAGLSSYADKNHFKAHAFYYCKRNNAFDVWSIDQNRTIVHEKNGV